MIAVGELSVCLADNFKVRELRSVISLSTLVANVLFDDDNSLNLDVNDTILEFNNSESCFKTQNFCLQYHGAICQQYALIVQHNCLTYNNIPHY